MRALGFGANLDPYREDRPLTDEKLRHHRGAHVSRPAQAGRRDRLTRAAIITGKCPSPIHGFPPTVVGWNNDREGTVQALTRPTPREVRIDRSIAGRNGDVYLQQCHTGAARRSLQVFAAIPRRIPAEQDTTPDSLTRSARELGMNPKKLMLASGTSNRTPRTPGQSRRLPSGAPRTDA